MSFINTFVLKLWKWYKGHEGVANAHHTKYTDVEVDAIVAVHTAIPAAHHTKYTDVEAVDAIEDSGGIDVEGATNPMIAVHDTNQATKSAKLGVVKAGANSYPGIWLAAATPSVTNYAFLGGGAYTLFNSPAGGYIQFRIANANKVKIHTSGGFAIGDGCSASDPGYNNTYVQKRLGINQVVPGCALDVNSDLMRLRVAKTPASAGAAGNQGDICWDADYLYICTATNTWKRSAISSW